MVYLPFIILLNNLCLMGNFIAAFPEMYRAIHHGITLSTL